MEENITNEVMNTVMELPKQEVTKSSMTGVAIASGVTGFAFGIIGTFLVGKIINKIKNNPTIVYYDEAGNPDASEEDDSEEE